ncbi:MAG: hypothetical protein HY960_13175 [Ignavibacteriae bacterium]|nr:hypothetical protein [Ignavibacteriota bacterium]
MNILFSLFVIVMMLVSSGDKSKPSVNKFVQCEIKLVEQSLKAGSTGTVQISFKPTKGIHVNLDPPMSLNLDKSDVISKIEKLETTKDKKHDYLDATKPVTAKFTITKNAKPGTIKLKGTFTYFYCSDAEGWCNRFKQPIELALTITK